MELPFWVSIATIAGGLLGFVSIFFSVSDYIKTHIKDENRVKLKKCIPLTYNECFNADEPELINKHDFAKIYGLIYNILEFNKNGNSFSGIRTRWLFGQVHKRATLINESFGNFTAFAFVHGGTGEHAIAEYKKREQDVVKLAEAYKNFYRHVNGYLSHHDDIEEEAEYIA